MKPVLVPQSGTSGVLGATITADGANFAVYSETASVVHVCLFDEQDREFGRFELDTHHGPVHCGLVAGIGAGTRYGLRADGRYDPGKGLFFDPNKLLVDPYARRLDRPFVYSPLLAVPREREQDTAPLVPKAYVMGARANGSGGGRRRPQPQFIYELNVRAFTKRHPEVPGPLRGTLQGLTSPAVVEHLKRIGVDMVELMPVAAWIDERHLSALGLRNAWGYNPVAYSAPDPRLAPGGMQDLRDLTSALRAAGISVILDVVYNHTGEGDAHGPVLSLRGLDPLTYYRHIETERGLELVNDTGCGNTLRCDHPAVVRLVIDSLRRWVHDGGVDGFRFDLAPVLGRGDNGFDSNAPLLQAMRRDRVLSRCLMVAEPWDVGPGGYQLGAFGREFLEWNDRYRDDVRRFWRGDASAMGVFAERLSGSEPIFHHGGRRPNASVNFVAAHDGFTLADTVAFTSKHNAANGEQNRDGHTQNFSWNNGVEGHSEDADIVMARRRDVRTLLATLMLSRGTPMLTAGDETGRSQRGNNNAYAQDNELTWIDWESADGELIGFVEELARFRRRHPALTDDHFLTGKPRHGHRDVVWLAPSGEEMRVEDWHNPQASVLGMHLNVEGDELLIWFNRRRTAEDVTCPPAAAGKPWKVALCSDPEFALRMSRRALRLPPRSVVVLTG